jgi:hypothetical protein
MSNLRGVTFLSLLLVSIGSAHANCVGPTVMGDCLSNTDVRNYGSDDHKASSGRTYDYDLSNPADRNRYSIDLDAQRRDGNQDLDRDRDQSLGQSGGGIRSE